MVGRGAFVVSKVGWFFLVLAVLVSVAGGVVDSILEDGARTGQPTGTYVVELKDEVMVPRIDTWMENFGWYDDLSRNRRELREGGQRGLDRWVVEAKWAFAWPFVRAGQSLSLIEDERREGSEVRRLNGYLRSRGFDGFSVDRWTNTLSRTFTAELSKSEVKTLSGHPDVRRVSGNTRITLHNDVVRSTIGVDGLEAAGAIPASGGGRGVVVGVLDTGIDYTHPDLGGCLGTGCIVIGGIDIITGEPDPMDDRYHGTHVAGTIAGNGPVFRGIAPGAKLVGIKIFDEDGGSSLEYVLAGMDYAMDPNRDGMYDDRVDIASMSWGADGEGSDQVTEAANKMMKIGTVAVVSAGNCGRFCFAHPANSIRAITVGATYKQDYPNFKNMGVHGDENPTKDQVTGYSSKGPFIATDEETGKVIYAIQKPDVVAPGALLCSTRSSRLTSDLIKPEYLEFWGKLNKDGLEHCDVDEPYLLIQGTSMAAPVVSGLAALLRAEHPAWSADEIRDTIVGTAKDLGLPRYEQGAGRVDAQKAIHASKPFPGVVPLVSGTRLGTVSLRVTVRSRGGGRITGELLDIPSFGGYPGRAGDEVIPLGDTSDRSPERTKVGSKKKHKFSLLVRGGGDYLIGTLNTADLESGVYLFRVRFKDAFGREVVGESYFEFKNLVLWRPPSLLKVGAAYDVNWFRNGQIITILGEMNLPRGGLADSSITVGHEMVYHKVIRVSSEDSELGRFELKGLKGKDNGMGKVEVVLKNENGRTIGEESSVIYITSRVKAPFPVALGGCPPRSTTPGLFDWDEDGKLDIVVLCDGKTRVFSGEGVELYSEVAGGEYGAAVVRDNGKVRWVYSKTAAPVLSDITGDGSYDQIEVNTREVGVKLNGLWYGNWPFDLGGFIGNRKEDDFGIGRGTTTTEIGLVVSGDVTGDGEPEIVVGTGSRLRKPLGPYGDDPNTLLLRLGAVFVFSWRGALLGRLNLRGGTNYRDFVLVDGDGDGKVEIVGVGPSGFINGAWVDGKVKWSKVDIGDIRHVSDIAAGDVDGDGKTELAFWVEWYSGGRELLITTTEGKIKTKISLDEYFDSIWQKTTEPGEPLIGDTNGDGKPDIVLTSRVLLSSYGHMVPLHLIKKGEDTLFRAMVFDGDGSFLEKESGWIPDGQWGRGAIGDVDGDGVNELVLLTEATFPGESTNLLVWDFSGGSLVPWGQYRRDIRHSGTIPPEKGLPSFTLKIEASGGSVRGKLFNRLEGSDVHTTWDWDSDGSVEQEGRLVSAYTPGMGWGRAEISVSTAGGTRTFRKRMFKDERGVQVPRVHVALFPSCAGGVGAMSQYDMTLDVVRGVERRLQDNLDLVLDEALVADSHASLCQPHVPFFTKDRLVEGEKSVIIGLQNNLRPGLDDVFERDYERSKVFAILVRKRYLAEAKLFAKSFEGREPKVFPMSCSGVRVNADLGRYESYGDDWARILCLNPDVAFYVRIPYEESGKESVTQRLSMAIERYAEGSLEVMVAPKRKGVTNRIVFSVGCERFSASDIREGVGTVRGILADIVKAKPEVELADQEDCTKSEGTGTGIPVMINIGIQPWNEIYFSPEVGEELQRGIMAAVEDSLLLIGDSSPEMFDIRCAIPELDVWTIHNYLCPSSPNAFAVSIRSRLVSENPDKVRTFLDALVESLAQLSVPESGVIAGEE